MTSFLSTQKNEVEDVKNKCIAIDFFKFIFAFFVIAIHLKPAIYLENYILKALFNQIVSVAVPFFFLASGFLISSKLTDNAERNTLIIKQHFKKTLLLYIKWEAIYFPLTIYGLLKENGSIFDKMLYFLQRLIFVGELYNSWHLWYLLASIYAYFLLVCISKKHISKFRNYLLLLAITSIMLSIAVDLVRSVNVNSFHWVNVMKIVIDSTIISSRVLSGMIFIPIGMILYKFSSSVHLGVISFLILFLADLLINNYFVSFIISTVYYALLFNLILNLHIAISASTAKKMRHMSTVIYLIHMYVWTVVYTLLFHKQTFGLEIFVLVCIICLVCAYLWNLIEVYYKSKMS